MSAVPVDVQGVQGNVQGGVHGEPFVALGMCRVCSPIPYTDVRDIASILNPHGGSPARVPSPAHPAHPAQCLCGGHLTDSEPCTGGCTGCTHPRAREFFQTNLLLKEERKG